MHALKILLVEHEQAIANTLINALGSDSLPAHHDSPFDLIILTGATYR